ncbi:MAG: hypothetical protein ACKPBC_02015 [Sphaerospermopsis kisseleviana]
MRKPSNDSGSLSCKSQLEKYRVWLRRASLLRDNCSHAPVEVESKV